MKYYLIFSTTEKWFLNLGGKQAYDPISASWFTKEEAEKCLEIFEEVLELKGEFKIIPFNS